MWKHCKAHRRSAARDTGLHVGCVLSVLRAANEWSTIHRSYGGVDGFAHLQCEAGYTCGCVAP